MTERFEDDVTDYLFTWPDRGLTYDCRGCGACCRGLGIGLDAAAGQLDQLLGHYPALAPYVRRRGPALTIFNPRDRCWFLADDGLCRVEVDHGRASKPASCRLFPFNRVFRLGDLTVVDYNSVICPLQRAANGQGGIAHAEIAAEIESIADPAIVGTALPGDIDAAVFAARERDIATRCFAAAEARSLDSLTGDLVDTDAIFAALKELTGQSLSLPAGDTLANALVLTPSMRFNELFGPRQYVARDKLIPILPGMWLAWLAFAGAAADLAARPLSLQELTTMWTELAPLTYAAARWHHRPHFQPGPVELPGSAEDPDSTVRRFGEACVANRKARKPLGRLWTSSIGNRAAADAVTLLKLADPILRKLTWR